MAADFTTLAPVCPPRHRPEALFSGTAPAHGLRAAQTHLVGAQRVLEVWLYGDPPAGLASPAVWRLQPAPGGTPVPIAGAAVVAAPAPHIELTLSGLPDTARYRLLVDPPAGVPFDPLRTWLPVRLRPECPDLGSCFTDTDPPPSPPPSPVHDYLARDWRSLRAALVEFLARRHPGADLSIADPAVTIAELFAHLGDLLHYRLDRTATEAYLETARRRTSVRRHARLVDFPLAEAAAARTSVLVEAPPGGTDVQVRAGDVACDHAGSPLAFTLESDLLARPALGEIPIYDFGEGACCLPAGATECVLVRPTPADALGAGWLGEGDLLVFEVVGVEDRRAHRRWATRQEAWPVTLPTLALRSPLASRTAQVVRLTETVPFEDPLLGAGLELTLVRWAAEDALVRSYPVGIDSGAGADEVTVARANLVSAHHGRPVDAPPGDTATLTPRPRVGEEPDRTAIGTYSMVAAGTPAAPGRAGGPGLALDQAGAPHLLKVEVHLPTGPVGAQLVRSLIDPDAAGTDFAFVVDSEEDEPPIVAFRTGAMGRAIPPGTPVTARYEVGGGRIGNVPADALHVLERNGSGPGAAPTWQVVPVAVRNPAAATGGSDRMPLDEARRDAPERFAIEPARAVLPADHALAAAADDRVQQAMARRTWTGAWPLITTVVDLSVAGNTAAAVRGQLQQTLDGLRMIGTEVFVVDGVPIGLFVALQVCAGPAADAEAVRRDVLRALRPGTDDRPGVFHPSRLVLGSAVYLSTVVATAAAVPGVDAVEVVEARRLDEPVGTVHDVLAFASDEVPVLDDDPAQPGRGRLDVVVRGGR